MRRLLGSWIPLAAVAVGLVATQAGAVSSATSAVAVSPTVKILINKDGWHSVSRTTLETAGFVFPADLTLLHLSMDGQDVPFEYRNASLQFYGQALDTLYTDTRPYFLSVGATPGLAMQFLRARAAASAPSGSYDATVTVRDRRQYVTPLLTQANPGSQPGNNIFGFGAATVNQQVNLPNADTAQTATFKLDLYGFVVGANPPQHQMNVAFNGTNLGATLTGSGNQPITHTYTNVTIQSGANTVTLTNPLAPNDVVLPDAYTVTYKHLFLADSDALTFPVSAGSPVSVGGFTTNDVRLLDISNPTAPKELFPTISPTGPPYTISITPPVNATKLYAFTGTTTNTVGASQVVVDNPSSLKSPSNQADLIVIAYKDATRDFISDVQPLVTLRQSQLTVKVANVQDVFDEFGQPLGAHGPEAIKSFLQYAYTTWQNPKPKYVLLAGDASQDPRAYFASPSNDFIPTLYFDATFLESPSDDALSDFNNDARPELAVGRLPARTDAEMNLMVSKIVGYSATAPRSKSALLVADNFDKADYCFGVTRPECSYTAFSDDMQNSSLTPNGVSVTRINRADGSAGDTATHNDVMTAASAGPILVNWFGHGGFQSWNGTPALLRTTDAPSISNTGLLSVYMMMTCQTGYFVGTNFNGLGEALLLAPNAAVAAWGSSGDTVPYDQVRAAKLATAELFSDPSKRLGDAMFDAKNSPTVTDLDVLRTWELLGDPTMKLNLQ